jgi:hypothetical protein
MPMSCGVARWVEETVNRRRAGGEHPLTDTTIEMQVPVGFERREQNGEERLQSLAVGDDYFCRRRAGERVGPRSGVPASRWPR